MTDDQDTVDQKIWCPLGFTVGAYCQPTCVWWDSVMGKCAVVKIAETHVKLLGDMQQIGSILLRIAEDLEEVNDL
jgi:hypothetical protein